MKIDSDCVSFLFMKKIHLYLIATVLIALASCNKSTETLGSKEIAEYAPYTVGKYISYQLDSLLYINFGTKDTTVSYQVKYYVDAQIKDNLGRDAFRIIRYIRKTADDAWRSDNTFMAVPTGRTLEFIENNQRFIKLAKPIKDDFSWKGNIYIDTYSFDSDVKYLDDWDYTYQNVDMPLSIGSYSFDSTLTVNQRDEVLNDPNNPEVYSEINTGIEKYAKGVGMIYKKFWHREYQPPTPGGTQGYSIGYGITLSIIDHN